MFWLRLVTVRIMKRVRFGSTFVSETFPGSIQLDLVRTGFENFAFFMHKNHIK